MARPRVGAGECDRRVIIETPSRTLASGGTGAGSDTWSAHATVWARRSVLRGMELFSTSQFDGKSFATFELRHAVSGLKSDMRVNDSGDYWDITGILPAERTGGGQKIHAYLHRD